METTTGQRPTIVVGVDGSSASRAALAWATEEAELRGARLHAVQAWERPVGALPLTHWSRAYFDGEVRRELSSTLENVIRDHPSIDLRTSVTEGDPVNVLVETAEAEHADMLVLGRHGRRNLTSFFFGSVSKRCLANAHCAVAVVRPFDTEESDV